MVKGESSIEVSKPIEEVFEYVADGFFENYPKWAPEIAELAKTSDGPLDVGTTGRWVREAGDRVEVDTFVITEYQPGRRFAFSTTTGSRHLRASYTFVPVGPDTRLVYSCEVVLAGVLKLAEPLLAGTVRKDSDEITSNLANLFDLRAYSQGV